MCLDLTPLRTVSQRAKSSCGVEARTIASPAHVKTSWSATELRENVCKLLSNCTEGTLQKQKNTRGFKFPKTWITVKTLKHFESLARELEHDKILEKSETLLTFYGLIGTVLLQFLD